MFFAWFKVRLKVKAQRQLRPDNCLAHSGIEHVNTFPDKSYAPNTPFSNVGLVHEHRYYYPTNVFSLSINYHSLHDKNESMHYTHWME